MILVRALPTEKIPKVMTCNTLLYSPWTGEPWAKIDRGYSDWLGTRLPSEGERPFLDSHIPGSLYLAYDLTWAAWELPLDMVMRELLLLEDYTRGELSLYNSHTKPESPMSQALMERIASLRVKIAQNTATDEELREALRAMRQDRVTAAAVSSASRARKETIDPDAALKEFLSS